MAPTHSEFVTSTVTALRAQLRCSDTERRRGILEDLLTLMRDLKSSRHPAAGLLAAAVGRDIIPLFGAEPQDSDRYRYEREEEIVADIAAGRAAVAMAVFRATDYFPDPIPYAAAFRFWNAPCFLSPEFEDGLRQLFLDALRNSGRGRKAETALYKPLADIAEDADALASTKEALGVQAVGYVLETLAVIRKNDPPFQYLCLERLKTHSIENGYHLYNDLDFAFLESMIQLPQIQVQRIHKKIQEAWDRELPPEKFVAQLEALADEADAYVLDCAILSAFYHRQGCRLDFKSLYRILIGTNRNIDVSRSLRPVLTGELMRIPNRLAYELAEGDADQAPYRFGLLVAVLTAIGRANLPGLEDQILALIWGRDEYRGLIEWINQGYPADALPEMIDPPQVAPRRAYG